MAYIAAHVSYRNECDFWLAHEGCLRDRVPAKKVAGS